MIGFVLSLVDQSLIEGFYAVVQDIEIRISPLVSKRAIVSINFSLTWS
jgi:hypothetical protein